jgi:hypothetical protein
VIDECLSPLYGRDSNGSIRTWPLFAGPEPEDLIEPWQQPVLWPLPRLVEPGPLRDEMEVASWDAK